MKLSGELAEARAEIERLRDQVEMHRKLFAESALLAVEWERKAEKAEAERDEARAQVAAAYEVAANASMESGPSYFMTQTGGGFQETHTKLGAFAFRTDIRDAIRALTPADAKSALDAYGREKVREGMQRAAVMIQGNTPERIALRRAILAEMEKLK